MLTTIVAVYTLVLIYAFYYGGLVGGLVVAGFGVVMIALLPTFKKIQKQNIRNLIQEKSKQSFLNVNKAPWYILEELPGIERVVAKRIVYIRNKYGKYSSIDDFFTKLGIGAEQKRELERIVRV